MSGYERPPTHTQKWGERSEAWVRDCERSEPSDRVKRIYMVRANSDACMGRDNKDACIARGIIIGHSQLGIAKYLGP